jgi:hypothetical protein
MLLMRRTNRLPPPTVDAVGMGDIAAAQKRQIFMSRDSGFDALHRPERRFRSLKIESENKHRCRPGLEPGPQRERNCAHRGTAAYRLGDVAVALLHTYRRWSRRSPGRRGWDCYPGASIHSAAPRQSVSRCSGRTVAGATVIIGQGRVAAPCELAGESPVDLARHRGSRIDQDGMALGPARQKQRRPQQISVRSGEGDVVDENVVRRSFTHREFPRRFATS